MPALRWLRWLLAITVSQANADSFSVVSDIFESWAIPHLQKAALNLKKFMEIEEDRAIDFNWFPSGATPRNMLEHAVAAVMESNIERGMVNAAEVAGVSWWINSAPDDDDSTLENFHFDCDMIAQNLLNDSSAIITPLLSTVTYFTDYGGPTAVFTDYDTERRLDEDALPLELFLSFPKANKHISFDSLRLHGTLATVASSGTSKGKKKRRSKKADNIDSQRISLAVNFWDYQENVAKTPSRHYAQDPNFRDAVVGKPLRSSTAKIGVPELQDLTRIVAEKADDDNAWRTLALKSSEKAYLKPKTPHELKLQIPHKLLADLSPGDDVLLKIPPRRHPVLKYDEKAKLLIGLPGVQLEAPKGTPAAEKKKWAKFVSDAKQKVVKSLSRRCTMAKYQELTMCKNNLIQAELVTRDGGSNETCGASPESCSSGTGSPSEGKEQRGTDREPPKEVSAEGATEKKRKARKRKEGAGTRRRRSEDEDEDEDEKKEKEEKYAQLLEQGIQAAEGGKQKLAREYLLEAIKLRPSIASQAHFVLGVLDAQEDKSSEALFRFQTAVKINPGHTDAQKNVDVLLARGVTPSE